MKIYNITTFVMASAIINIHIFCVNFCVYNTELFIQCISLKFKNTINIHIVSSIKRHQRMIQTGDQLIDPLFDGHQSSFYRLLSTIFSIETFYCCFFFQKYLKRNNWNIFNIKKYPRRKRFELVLQFDYMLNLFYRKRFDSSRNCSNQYTPNQTSKREGRKFTVHKIMIDGAAPFIFYCRI
jgi:hypothetical protein